ncbi:MAG: SGNH/GDSL hydrolase family protein [Myxococcales bacterium]|nr:SGNH/GDSL hydrolase family protein [Myxococcales bacterium]
MRRRLLSRLLARLLTSSVLLLVVLMGAQAFAKGPFKDPTRTVKAVIVGGSISMYYRGNYGQFLQHGCKNLEVVNRAKVGAGGPALVKRLRKAVIGDRRLMKQVRGKRPWLLFQGGLNSVYSPEMTNANLAKMFKLAKDNGFQTFALSLTPWGDPSDKRFRGFNGVFYVRATKRINAFLLGKLTPDQALGARAKKHPHEWMKGEVPDRAVDVFHSHLRNSDAALLPAAPLARKFSRSRYRKRKKNKAKLIAEARSVPRNYLKKSYRDFDHIHPNSKGHRLLAARVCAKAPASWGCDCNRIKRAVFKGHVRDPK